ncbi:MAG: hypothetical protein ACK5LC_09405 [Coprobacillaceae bacterium]
MSLLLKVSGIISIVLLSCTIFCGVWLKFHPVDDKSFHFILSISSVIVALITIVLFMMNFKK